MTCILRALLAALCLLLPGSAFGQGAVLQGGPWTPGRVPMYVGQSTSQTVIMDGGSAAGGAVGATISELGVTARGTGAPPYVGAGPYGTNICDYDAPTNSASGYHYLCLSANAQGGGLIAYGAGGTASQLPLSMIVNGSKYEFPFSTSGVIGPATSTPGDLACWNNSSGTLLKDCGATLPASLTIPSPIITGVTKFSGPIPWIDVTAPPYNAKLDGTTDDTAAFQAAIAAATGNNQTVYIPCLGGNRVSVVSQTLVIGVGVHLDASCMSGQGQGSSAVRSGFSFKWAGATGIPVIKFFGAVRSGLNGIQVDCNSVADCIGIQYASNNSPSTSYNTFTDVSIYNAHIGLVIGDPTNTVPPLSGGLPVCVTFSNLNCAQADNLTINRLSIIGNGIDTTAVGIHVNDANGLQSSRIYEGLFQGLSIGLHIIWNNGGWSFESFTGGNPVGEKTFIKTEQYALNPPALVNNETEGTFTYAIHDLGDNTGGDLPSYFYPWTLQYNQWNNPILCEGNRRILSMGNAGGAPSNPWTAGGNCAVVSILEPTTANTTAFTPWVTTSNGEVTAWGSQFGQSVITAKNVGAGRVPTALPISTGQMWISSDGDNALARLTWGADGTVYMQRSINQITLTGAAFGAGVTPTAADTGDLWAAKDATHGTIWLGGDIGTYLRRTGNDLNIVTPGKVTFNGAPAVATNVQIFTSNGTYTPSTGIKAADFYVVGGGGGGGGGALQAASTAVSGGGGGGGAAILNASFTAAQLSSYGSSFTVSVGTGGNGGAAATSNSTAGGNGTAGVQSLVQNGSNILIRAGGGGAGAGGQLAGNSGGGGGGGAQTGGSASTGSGGSAGLGFGAAGGSGTSGAASTGNDHGGSGGGGGPSTGATGTASGLSSFGASGGGAGGGISAANVFSAGGSGSVVIGQGAAVTNTGTGGGSSGAPGGNGYTWTNGPFTVGGMGGGGGAGGTTAGGTGGNGGGPGGGGGGGGSSQNGGTAGAGGAGANGIVIVVEQF